MTTMTDTGTTTLLTDSYFDGDRLHSKGPFTITINNGIIDSIQEGLVGKGERVSFVMPGLVESHCHIFLNGHENDCAKRSAYLKGPRDTMLAVAHKNVEHNLSAGITLIRDAGDKHGINKDIRTFYAQEQNHNPDIRSPGLAIRKKGRYGSFMARELTDECDIDTVIDHISTDADDIKILLTGIIDFAHGIVKGAPQFTFDETLALVQAAHKRNKKTYAHCSGQEGLKIAVDAGIDSIEHGFFMSTDILEKMADKQIAWVPTFSPVFFQWDQPKYIGWDQASLDGLRRILDQHTEMIGQAHQLGVPIVAGSDAGSHGVPHGRALHAELRFLHEAGLPLDAVLRAGTSVPRHLWNCPSAHIVTGNTANLVTLQHSPTEAIEYLSTIHQIIRGQHHFSPSL